MKAQSAPTEGARIQMYLSDLDPEVLDREAFVYEDDPYFTDPYFRALCDDEPDPDDPRFAPEGPVDL